MNDTASELEAIRHTMAAYNIAGDRMRLEALAATFAPHGVLETPTARMEGREAILAGLGRGRGSDPPASDTLRGPTFVRHNLTTSLLDLTSEVNAEARSYFMVFTDIGPDHMGCYVDRLIKLDGRWLFEHRRVLIDWMSERTLFTNLLDAHRARRAEVLARRASGGVLIEGQRN
jgi:hypothetical protein